MKLIHFIVTFAFVLSLCNGASDGDTQPRDDVRTDVTTGGLKGFSRARAAAAGANGEVVDDAGRSRQLTWFPWWRWKKKKKRKTSGYRTVYVSNNKKPTSPTSIGTAKRSNFNIKGFLRNATFADSDVDQLGGKYLFNTFLAQDEGLTEEFEGGNSFFTSGDCTRIQVLQVNGTSRLLGAGLCTFVMTVVTDRARGAITIHGELFDRIPSTFAIAGGTQNFDGARGNVVFTPFYDNEGDIDVFTEASHIEVAVKASILDDVF